MLKPRSLLIAALALTGAGAALHPAPAFAGRAAACKAPPFSVPSETQRAVDAAIDARIASAGSGKVGASVDTRTEYETTTLSQDAVARAWVEYTLCLKLAKRLIGQDLHDELLRGLLSPVTAAGSASSVVPSSSDASPNPSVAVSDVVGTWQVVSRFTFGTCDDDNEPRTDAYTWLVSAGPEAQLSVSVQGNTGYPRLTGAIQDGHLRLGAPRTRDNAPSPKPLMDAGNGRTVSILDRSDYDLTLQQGKLVGTREVAWWTTRLTDEDRNLVVETCVLHFEVEAQR